MPVGVQLVNVNDSIIQNSTFDGTGNAIYLSEVLGSHIIGNSIRNPGTGIILYSSSQNHFSSNSITSTGRRGSGMYISDYSDFNSIDGNVFSRLAYGLYKEEYWQRWGYSYGNNITGNHFTDNAYGLSVEALDYGMLANNVISQNGYGMRMSWFSGNLFAGNVIEGNNNTGLEFWGEGNTIRGNRISANKLHGIAFGGDSNIISGNDISFNQKTGIAMSGNANNITGNTIKNNSVGLNDTSSNGTYAIKNRVFNNFFSNQKNAAGRGNTFWNATKTPGANIARGSYLGGNYWSDYTGTDTDGDGLGNTNLPYNSGGSITSGGDYMPLIRQAPPQAGCSYNKKLGGNVCK